MKTLYFSFIALLLISSCASDKVMSDSWIQKRKYNKGFYIAKKTKTEKAEPIEKVKAIHENTSLENTPVLLSPEEKIKKLEGDIMQKFKISKEHLSKLLLFIKSKKEEEISFLLINKTSLISYIISFLFFKLLSQDIQCLLKLNKIGSFISL